MANSTFTPTNKLEEILVAACTDPSARPEFYRYLLQSDLFLLTPNVPERERKTTLETSTQVSFVNFNGPNGTFLPIFTSQQRLQEAVNELGQQYGFLALHGKDLFPVLTQRPQPAVLNPGSAYGKELTPDEIRGIADGSFGQNEGRVIQAATQVLIGQPAKYPTELVAALQKLFGKYESVEAAYLGLIHEPSNGDPPHLIVGIECKGDMEAISRDAGICSQGLLENDGIVDFIQVGGANKGSLDSYFKNQTKPFYQRPTKKAFWKVW